MTNPLNPLYYAVAWCILRIHDAVGLVIHVNSLEWVLSIVLLVVIMRLLLVPLFIKQMHAMRNMSALAPQMQELRKKYKNDRQTLNEETMKLYKEHGVNPLGGCLPLLAQLPLFFALFGVLRAISTAKPGTKVYGIPSALIAEAQKANILGASLADKVLLTGTKLHVPLSAKAVIVGAVLISVGTTYLTVRQSQKRGMTPQMTPSDSPLASSQKFMTYLVPLFALSGLWWQFGLVLYWVTTNVWTLGQQHVLFKRFPPTAAAAAAAGTGSAGGKSTAPPKPGGVPAAPKVKTSPPKIQSGRTSASSPGGKQAAAKPGTAKPGSGKAAPAKPKSATGSVAAKPAAANPVPAKPAAQRPGGAARSAAASGKPASPPPVKPGNGQRPATAKPAATGSGAGLLRRIGRGRAEEEPQPEVPEVKIVRQQTQRQSRSKRSGRR